MADEFKNSVDIYDELQRCVDGLKDLQQQINNVAITGKSAREAIEKRIGNIRIENGWPEVSGINKRLDALEALDGPYEAICEKRIKDLEDMVAGKRNNSSVNVMDNFVDHATTTIGRMILNMPQDMELVRTENEWVYGPSNDPFNERKVIHYTSLLETLTKAGLDK